MAHGAVKWFNPETGSRFVTPRDVGLSLVTVNGSLCSNYLAHIGPSWTVVSRGASTPEGRHRPRVAPDSATKVSQIIRTFTPLSTLRRRPHRRRRMTLGPPWVATPSTYSSS